MFNNQTDPKKADGKKIRSTAPVKPQREPLDQGLASVVQKVLKEHQGVPGALLPVLHQIQDQIGFIPTNAVELIAQSLLLSRAEVHGVISYYHHFRQTAPANNVVQVCVAESCRAMGAQALMQHVKTSLKIEPHGVSSDAQFSVEPVYCLGLCASSPALMINQTLYARVDHVLFDQLISEIATGQTNSQTNEAIYLSSSSVKS